MFPGPSTIKGWIAFLMTDIVVGIVFGFGYHFFGAQLKNRETGMTEIETLANSVKYFEKPGDTKDVPSKKL